MEYADIRRAYLENQLTRDEINIALANLGYTVQQFQEAFYDWNLIIGLRAEKRALRLLKTAPRLERSLVTDLIDFALAQDYIERETAINYLTSDGLLPEVAASHADTILLIAKHDKERQQYLDDPDHAPRYCTRCGKETPHQQLSNRGICYTCGSEAVIQACENLTNRHGPIYEKWRHNLLASLGRPGTEIEINDLAYFDRDKAPPCQNDCEDCPDETCRSRVEPYCPKEDQPDDLAWECPYCRSLNHPADSKCWACELGRPTDQ